jgi:hypothetical protein
LPANRRTAKAAEVSKKSVPKVSNKGSKTSGSETDTKSLTASERYKLYSQCLELAKLIVWFGGLGMIVLLFITLPTYFAAGKQTSLTIAYNAIADLKLHMVVPYAVAACLGVLWKRERNLRKTTVEREHRRVAELEKKLDPGRESSELTPRGETPRDLR